MPTKPKYSHIDSLNSYRESDVLKRQMMALQAFQLVESLKSQLEEKENELEKKNIIIEQLKKQIR